MNFAIFVGLIAIVLAMLWPLAFLCGAIFGGLKVDQEEASPIKRVSVGLVLCVIIALGINGAVDLIGAWE